MATFRVDCDDCVGRGPACGDCVVNLLLVGPAPALDLDDGEQRALSVLADAGLVPPLRMKSSAATFGDSLKIV